MIANVQYNDMRGTAAADISDFLNNNLQEYLEKTYPESYDGSRYYCQGCRIWVGQAKPNIYFICYCKETKGHVLYCPKHDCSLEEVFNLFKRFEIVIGNDINEVKVDENDVRELV